MMKGVHYDKRRAKILHGFHFEKNRKYSKSIRYTNEVMDFLTQEAWSMGFAAERNNKGGIIITVPGKTQKVLGLGAHWRYTGRYGPVSDERRLSEDFSRRRLHDVDH